MSTLNLNPDHVPPFPVYSLEYDGNTVLLDKVMIEPAPGQELTEAGIHAVARKADEAGLSAVRVRVVTPEGSHLMIVDSEGEAVDITPSTAPAKPSRRKKALILAGSALTLLLLAGGGVWAGMAITAANTEPVASTPPPNPGNGTPIPIGLPTGFATTAAWAVPIAERKPPVVLDNGNVLLTTPSDTLEIREPERATTVWTSPTAPTGSNPLVETTWTGRPVLASATGDTLTLWPLDLPDTTGVAAVPIALGAQAQITYAGTAPLIDLGDYTVAVPGAKDGIQRLNIPPGTHPVAAGSDIVISVGDNSISYTPSTPAGEARTVPFDRPKDTTGGPTSAVGLTPTRALVTWQSKTSDITALLDTETGTILATITGRSPDSRQLPQVDDTAGTALIGSYLVSFEQNPKIFEIDTSSREATLDGDHVYATTTGGSIDLTITGDKLVPSQWPLLAPDDPAPAAVSADAAYVVAQKVDRSILYRAPRQSQEAP